jgi:hypothetical protein
MKRLTSHAFYKKGFRFAELVIDKENHASRRMAEKVGYELMEILAVKTQGKLGSGKYCRYIIFNGEIESIAENYHKQPIDLIDHPAYDKEFRYLIHDDWINSYLAWPWEIMNKKEYEGEPFGLELDQMMHEAQIEEEVFMEEQRARLRPKSKLDISRYNLGWAIKKQ